MQWELTSLAVYGAMDCCVILGKLMMMISATAFSTAFSHCSELWPFPMQVKHLLSHFRTDFHTSMLVTFSHDAGKCFPEQ